MCQLMNNLKQIYIAYTQVFFKKNIYFCSVDNTNLQYVQAEAFWYSFFKTLLGNKNVSIFCCVYACITLVYIIIYSPEMAESSSFKVEDGDVLMLATDGLFDNLSEDMIIKSLSSLHVSIVLSVFKYFNIFFKWKFTLFV